MTRRTGGGPKEFVLVELVLNYYYGHQTVK